MIKFRWAMILPAMLMSAIMIAGCGGASSDISQQDRRDAYISVVRDNVPETAGSSDALLLDVGYAVCSDLDNGATLQDFVFLSMELEIDPSSMGEIIGASVIAFCPEHEDRLNEEVDNF